MGTLDGLPNWPPCDGQILERDWVKEPDYLVPGSYQSLMHTGEKAGNEVSTCGGRKSIDCKFEVSGSGFDFPL